MRWRRLARMASAFRDSRSGGFATMAATFVPIAIAVSAFAIDRGALVVEKQDLQSLTDLAAITAAANMNNASAAAILVINDNRTMDVTLSAPGSAYDATTHSTGHIDAIVERGHYTRLASIAAENRFQVGATPYNAARVTLRKGGNLYFAKSVLKTPLIQTSAVANVPAEAAFSIGSRLASVNNGVINSILGAFLGGNVSLSAMDYEALVRTDVSLFDFMGALATGLHLTGGTYNDVLNSSVSMGQIASALASVSGANQTAQLALQSIAAMPAATPPITVPLRHVIGLGSAAQLGIGEKPQGLDAKLSLMEMLAGSAAIASGGKQASVNLAGSVPGLLNLKLETAVGEPPQNSPFYAVGEVGTIVRTAQTRIKLTAEILPPGSGISLATIKLPLYIELAYAEGRLTDVSCPTGQPDSLRVGIAGRPGIADLYIGNVDSSQLSNFNASPTVTPAVLTDVNILNILGIKVPALRVSGSAHTQATNLSDTNLTFNKSEIDARTIKTVSTSDITQTLTQTLVNNLTLTVQVLIVGTPIPPALKTAITSALSPVTPALDSVIYSTLSALGVRLGEADIRVTAATCGRSVLVQ